MLTSLQQAFAEVLSQAAAGNTSNITVTPSDVRASLNIRYLTGYSDFPGLNTALYSALNGDWTLLQWADAFGIEYSESLLPSITTLCTDMRELHLVCAVEMGQ